MELIKSSSGTTNDAEAYATALNRSSADVKLIMGQIVRLRRLPLGTQDTLDRLTGRPHFRSAPKADIAFIGLAYLP